MISSNLNNDTIKELEEQDSETIFESVKSIYLYYAIPIGLILGLAFGPLGMLSGAVICLFLAFVIKLFMTLFKRTQKKKIEPDITQNYLQILRWSSFFIGKTKNSIQLLSFLNYSIMPFLVNNYDSEKLDDNKVVQEYLEILEKWETQELWNNYLADIFVSSKKISKTEFTELAVNLACCKLAFKGRKNIPETYEYMSELYERLNVYKYLKEIKILDTQGTDWTTLPKKLNSSNVTVCSNSNYCRSLFCDHCKHGKDTMLKSGDEKSQYLSNLSSFYIYEPNLIDQPTEIATQSMKDETRASQESIQASKEEILNDNKSILSDGSTNKANDKCDSSSVRNEVHKISAHSNAHVNCLVTEESPTQLEDEWNFAKSDYSKLDSIEGDKVSKKEENQVEDKKELTNDPDTDSCSITIKKCDSTKVKTSKGNTLAKQESTNQICFFTSFNDMKNFNLALKHKMPIGPTEYRFINDFYPEKPLLDWIFCYSADDVRIYKQFSDVGGSDLIMIKAYAFFEGITVDNVLYNLCCTERRKSWDHTFDVFELVETNINGNDIVYNVLKAPWPLSSRDFLQWRYINRFDDGSVAVMHRSAEHPAYPAYTTGKLIRGENIIGGYKFVPSQKGTEIFLVSQTDICGNVPRWLINSLAAKAPKQWIENFRRACNELKNKKIPKIVFKPLYRKGVLVRQLKQDNK